MVEAFHLKTHDYRIAPWKNGLGESREISIDEVEPFRWRVTTARLSCSSPFSPYPGYERVIVLLGGGPVTIHHENGKSRNLLPLAPYRFDGEWNTRSWVASPATDFNVFVRQGELKAGVYPAYFGAGEEMQFPIAGVEHFIFMIQGRLKVLEANGGQVFELEEGETLRVSRKSSDEFLNLRAMAASDHPICLWVVISETKGT